MFVLRDQSQLEWLFSLQTLEEGNECHISIDKYFIESRMVRHREVDLVCNGDGSRPGAIDTNDCYRDMNGMSEHLSKLKLYDDQYIILVRRFTDDFQDPYIFICKIEKIERDNVIVTVERKQRYGTRFSQSFGKFTNAVTFAVEKQLDVEGVAPHYSVNHRRTNENCIFVREKDRMVSVAEDGRTIVLDDRSMLHRRYTASGVMPPLAVLKCFYSKYGTSGHRKLIADGYQQHYLYRDEWIKNFSGMRASLGNKVSDLAHVDINGRSVLAIWNQEEDTIELIIKTGSEYELMPVSKNQRKKILGTIISFYLKMEGKLLPI
jgi:hypothetical protein